MTYKIYIKTDYKPVVRWVPDTPWYLRGRTYAWAFVGFLVSSFATIIASIPAAPESEFTAGPDTADYLYPGGELTGNVEPADYGPELGMVTLSLTPRVQADPVIHWQTIKVKPGDSLSLIFDKLKISPSVLHTIMTVSEHTKALKYLLPGQELRFHIDNGKLITLEYDQDLITTLQVNNDNEAYSSNIIKYELRKNVLEASATIDSSLFLAGQKAGLSDNLIMQLVAIYGWDIDFALDIRKGDRFRLIYEEHYKDDTKVSEGPILAAEFINQDKPYKSVRYIMPDGGSDYFADDGASMRKAFLRTPLNFTRISSGFSLNRKHPVLNKIRAHKGVDYAAPTGTPVKSAGNGTITEIGTNGGYGRSVVIKHGGTYSTLYAHLSKYAQGLKKGTRVKQGQTIGYVGMSGLATGPHLHYEFRVNGVHRNPLTVDLPKAESIPKELLADFKQQTAPLLAQLGEQYSPGIMIALREKDPLEEPADPQN